MRAEEQGQPERYKKRATEKIKRLSLIPGSWLLTQGIEAEAIESANGAVFDRAGIVERRTALNSPAENVFSLSGRGGT